MSRGTPQTRIDEIVGGIYRISTWTDDSPITMNQFLIDDERPTLIHTGVHPLYEAVRGAISQVLDPARLAFVALLHFEADECGGMERFVAEAPASTLVASALSVGINLRGWPCAGRIQGFSEGEVLYLGRHRLRFLETPHVHHWDSMMVFEETTRSLFPADLYMQPAPQPPVVDENLSAEMCALYRQAGIFAHEAPVRRVVERLQSLDPDWVHTMHGGTLTRAALPAYTEALREREFAYQGLLQGRRIEPPSTAEPASAEPLRAGTVS